MGFFSELKNDLSQAVNTLMPEDNSDEEASLDKDKATEDLIANGEKAEKVDIDSMLNRLDDIKLDEAGFETEQADETEEVFETEENVNEEAEEEQEEAHKEPKNALEFMAELREKASAAAEEPELEILEEKIEEETLAEVEDEEPHSALEAMSAARAQEYVPQPSAPVVENTVNYGGEEVMEFEQQTPTDETASITEGMVITGDIQTTGSLDLIGRVTGNIRCLGKLNITGEISGDSDAAEIYAESARITGEVRSKGSVKVGQSTVIVGNIYGSSAVIAGAVKGDIDVHGPVVLDTTAIVMGNIKSQSVQINNGAVIEGMCSQAYADVNPSEFFETLKNK